MIAGIEKGLKHLHFECSTEAGVGEVLQHLIWISKVQNSLSKSFKTLSS